MIQVDKNTTVKILKIRRPKIFAAITLSFEQDGFTEDWCVQNVQTKWQTVRPWSGPALFVQTYLSKNLGSLQYRECQSR